MEIVEKRNGERVLYTFKIKQKDISGVAEAIREYARKNEYAFTKEEKLSMPDESMQVYIYNNIGIRIASRVYTEKTMKRAREEARMVAEYAYALLTDTKLLRE